MELFIIYFVLYSFLGWVVESVYCAIIDKVWVNRGFLNGPVCPVYGIGSIAVLILLNPLKNNIVTLFFISVIITTLVEYVTAVILENLFNLKWWDYSTYKFNYKGRVCLLNSTLFGIGSVLLIKVVQPIIGSFVDKISIEYGTVLAIIFSLILIIDFIVTLLSLINMKQVIDRICTIKDEFRILEITVDKFTETELKKSFTKLKDKIEIHEAKSKMDEFYSKVKELKEHSAVQKRILRAFPNVKSLKYGKSFKDIKGNLFEYWNRKK